MTENLYKSLRVDPDFWANPVNLRLDVTLLGSGHNHRIGVLMDTRPTRSGSSPGYTSRSFGIRQSTCCNAVLAHSGTLCRSGQVRDCKQHCAKDNKCAVLSYGEAGGCYKPTTASNRAVSPRLTPATVRPAQCPPKYIR